MYILLGLAAAVTVALLLAAAGRRQLIEPAVCVMIAPLSIYRGLTRESELIVTVLDLAVGVFLLGWGVTTTLRLRRTPPNDPADPARQT